jgi:hypothetical protein
VVGSSWGRDAEAVDVLHNDIGDAFVDAAVEDAGDVGVLKLARLSRSSRNRPPRQRRSVARYSIVKRA